MTLAAPRAIRLERFADSFRAATDIIELPERFPGPGEITVRNIWCGVNGIFDTQIARNAVDYVKIAPPTLTGVEALGVVEAIGDRVRDFAVGDPVVTTRFTGGYRQSNTGPTTNFCHVPSTDRVWLALASTGVSALLALEHVGAVRDGETVAISAAAGGLGHLLVQLARTSWMLRSIRSAAVFSMRSWIISPCMAAWLQAAPRPTCKGGPKWSLRRGSCINSITRPHRFAVS
jgi:NADPH:quinone reductase-like Zn-dependent oxidoreductase